MEEEAPKPQPKKPALPAATPENEYIFDHLARVVQDLGGGTASLGAFSAIGEAIVEEPSSGSAKRSRRAKG